MRVLRVSHSAVVDEWRGRERALAALGVDVRLLSAHRWHAGGAEVELRARRGEHVRGVRTIGRHPALFLYDPRPIWRALGESWDVIDVHEEPFALATAEVLLLRALRRRSRRTPVVLYTAQNLRKRYPVPFRWLERHALREASGISACNREAARIAEAKGFGGRARVIPLGIDGSRFTPSDAWAAPAAKPGSSAAEASGSPEPIVVGFLGRLVAEKGVLVLLDAVAADRRLRLRLGGAGPLAAELAERAARLGIADRVELVGAVAPDDVVDFYRSIDVLAVPSIATPSWTEQFGRVAAEAMACGVPVVSSDAGALPDVVGGAGLVVPAGDAGALATALAEAAGPRRAELREAGIARAAQYEWDAVARDYLELYRSVLHGGPRPDAGQADPGTSPELEVVVVAYGSPELLRRALAPLVSLPLTVVDNSSLPEIAALCRELGVRYLDPGRNGGFAAGVNAALADRLVPGADVLLVNPDAEITVESVALLHRALRAEPDLASVGPSQSDGHGTTARVSWPFPSPRAAWREAIGFGAAKRGPRYVIGSVLLLRAEALAQVGGFDERFFLYAEETDWAYRAHRLGWRHRAVPEATARHVGGGTSSDPARRGAHFFASQERYLRKHHGALGWQSARAAQVLGSTVRGLVLPGERGRAARRRAAIYREGPVRAAARITAAPERAATAPGALHIVQIAPAIAPGSGVAGVAYHLEREFLAAGATVERFTAATAGRPPRTSRRSAVGTHLARARKVVWFSTVGTVRAKRFLAARPDAVTICHNDVLAGDVYVNHGLLQAAMRARGRYAWRMVRNPVHLFTAVRDRIRYRGRSHRAVVALTPGEARLLVSTYGRVRAPIHVIPNGVDTERFRPPSDEERAAARARLGLPDGRTVAVFVGHEFERKGLPIAIEALRHAPDAGLLVVGGTAEMIRRAEAVARRHGVAERVVFAGTHRDPVPFFHAADLLVLPSAYEANALVVLEALAAGLPVVSTRVGFAPELIADGENGYLVDRDPASVGARLDELSRADPEPWRTAARRTGEGYAWPAIARRYLELLESLRTGRDAA